MVQSQPPPVQIDKLQFHPALGQSHGATQDKKPSPWSRRLKDAAPGHFKLTIYSPPFLHASLNCLMEIAKNFNHEVVK